MREARLLVDEPTDMVDIRALVEGALRVDEGVCLQTQC